MEGYPWQANLSLTFSQILMDKQEAKIHQNIKKFKHKISSSIEKWICNKPLEALWSNWINLWEKCFAESDTNLRWQIPETFSIFGCSLSGIYWRRMGATVFVRFIKRESIAIWLYKNYQLIFFVTKVGLVLC